MGFKDRVRYLLGSLSVRDCFSVKNKCVQKTLQEKKTLKTSMQQEAKAQHAPGGCRGVGRDMANISPKFGVVRLSVRCGGQVDVKVTQNINWTK